MTQHILQLSDISKRYTTYASNIQRFANWFGASIKPRSEFWAVHKVSFDVARGESLALIGQNGAGKSTLLKIITGTVRSSRGRVTAAGRISAILELGLGFNPEFTGRQNVYHAGGLMGISYHELSELMPAIEQFAEIGSFFDQPLRVYSSGMQARLAFALATASRPDVLIVDEVLSVGDSYFQHKSFERIRSFRKEGCSVILVTHNMSDVRELCDRVLLLERGRIVKDGRPDEVVDYYNAMIAAKEDEHLSVEQRRKANDWLHTRSGTYEASVSDIQLVDATTDEPVKTARVGQKLVLRLTARIARDIPRLVLGHLLRDRSGHVVWGSNTWHTRQVIENLKCGEKVLFELPFTCTLGPGSYSFSPALVSSDTHLENNFEWQDNALVFDVVNVDRPLFIGTNWLNASFAIHRHQ